MSINAPVIDQARQLIQELAEMEFETSTDIKNFAAKVRALLVALGTALDYSAQELEGQLAELPPETPEEGGLTTARRAKSAMKHWRAAAKCCYAGATASIRGWASVKRHFGYTMGPQKKRKPRLDMTA